MSVTVLTKKHVTDMGFSVVLTEAEGGGYRIVVGGRPITKGNGEEMIYRGLSKALGRFDREVSEVEGWEAKLKYAGLWHPIRLCAGGCGLEMRISDRRFPDGTVETAAEQVERGDRVRCVACGPFSPEEIAEGIARNERWEARKQEERRLDEEDPVVKIVFKDEGDFGFIEKIRESQMDGLHRSTPWLVVLSKKRDTGEPLGVPYDPDRVRPSGSRAEARALARELDADYEEV